MSQFGTGLTYCLGLFLAHEFRKQEFLQGEDELRKKYPNESFGHAGLWANGAGDHLFELQCDYAPTYQIKDRCTILKNKVLNWRLAPNVTWADVDWSLREAKDLLMEIDKAHGVPVEKGDWE